MPWPFFRQIRARTARRRVTAPLFAAAAGAGVLRDHKPEMTRGLGHGRLD
jgi:hypothetical protein